MSAARCHSARPTDPITRSQANPHVDRHARQPGRGGADGDAPGYDLDDASHASARARARARCLSLSLVPQSADSVSSLRRRRNNCANWFVGALAVVFALIIFHSAEWNPDKEKYGMEIPESLVTVYSAIGTFYALLAGWRLSNSLGSHAGARAELGAIQGQLRRVNKYTCNYLVASGAETIAITHRCQSKWPKKMMCTTLCRTRTCSLALRRRTRYPIAPIGYTTPPPDIFDTL